METNLVNAQERVDTSLDSVVIRNYIEGFPGGRSLDMTDFDGAVIRAGHVVIEEEATGVYRPMPVEGARYAALPPGHRVVGLVASSRLSSRAMVPIMTRGSVNAGAAPYPFPESVRAALPLVLFVLD